MLGNYAGDNITTSDDNICLGYSAGEDISTGAGNICIGAYTGYYIETGSNNIYIGDQNEADGDVSNEIVIGTTSNTGQKIIGGHSANTLVAYTNNITAANLTTVLTNYGTATQLYAKNGRTYMIVMHGRLYMNDTSSTLEVLLHLRDGTTTLDSTTVLGYYRQTNHLAFKYFYTATSDITLNLRIAAQEVSTGINANIRDYGISVYEIG